MQMSGWGDSRELSCMARHHGLQEAVSCALVFGRASTNRCLSNEGTALGWTNPLMDDPKDGIDRTQGEFSVFRWWIPSLNSR